MANATSGESAQITPFSFGTHAVRVIDRDGSPWFVAADVCAALGYLNTSKALGDHLDADERSSALVPTPNAPLGVPTNVISESGLYALVLRSRKPEARKFAKWVTSEVLPAIRKTGRYEAQPAPASAIRLSDLIAAGNGIYIETEELHRIAAACMEKLAHRAKFYQAREIASRNSAKAVSMPI